MGDKFGLRGGDELRFLWVVEFPLFEHSEQEGRLVSVNHPFTAPNPDDLGFLAADPLKARALAYDVVLNGEEMGGGSIRIHNPELQMRVFELLGFSREEASEKFGFLLEALSYGAPPHGGIALGVDRLTMMLCHTDSLRDVMAFPKTQRAVDLMTGAPSEVDPRQLRELSHKGGEMNQGGLGLMRAVCAAALLCASCAPAWVPVVGKNPDVQVHVGALDQDHPVAAHRGDAAD